MSKRNKERAADAACRNGITLDKCINQINLAVDKLNRLERAGSDLRVRRISTSIANGLENGLKRVVSDEQRRSLVGTFGSAVLRLHEAVGRMDSQSREKPGLYAAAHPRCEIQGTLGRR